MMRQNTETISFRSEGHKQRLFTAIRAIDKVNDAGYAAALYILTADERAWQWLQTFVSHNGIDIEGMLSGLSGGESIMFQLAGNLFNGEQHIDPLEFTRLDESNFLLAIEAIFIRRYGLQIEE